MPGWSIGCFEDKLLQIRFLEVESLLRGLRISMGLKQVLEAAWIYLSEGVFDRRVTFHVPAVVYLRRSAAKYFHSGAFGEGVDKGRRTIRVLPDKRSKKCEQLPSNQSLAVNFYDEAKKVLIRLQAISDPL